MYNAGTLSSGTITTTGIQLLADAASNANDASLYLRRSNNNDWGLFVKGTSTATDYGIKVDLNGAHSYAFRGMNNTAEYFRVGTDMLLHNAQIRGGSFNVGTQEVITSGRNLTNIGTINSGAISSGNITAPKYYLGSSSSVYGVGIVNASSARFDTVDSGYSTDPLELVYHNGTGVVIGGSGGSKYLAAGSYQIGATTVIDASSNLTNIGTINSGAITSTGKVQGSYLQIAGSAQISRDVGSTNGSLRLSAYQGGSTTANKVTIGGGASSYSVFSSLGTTINQGGLSVGAQEVITSARALTNIVSYNGYDPSSSSSSTNSVISLDSRSVNSSPSARNKGLYVDFKTQSVIGLTGSGTYAGVLTFRAYGNGTDLSGGYPIQIAYDHAGALQTRIGSSATAWGSWKAILTSGGALSGTSVTSTAGSITSYGSVKAGQGGIYTNSVERITNAGNLTNIGTINSGAITATGYFDMSASGAYFKGNSAHGYRFNNQADTLNLVTIFDNGNVRLHQGSLQIGTTTVIDSSRNLTNIGTYTGLGTMTLGNYTGGEQLQFLANSNGTSHIYFRDNNQSEGTYIKANGENYGGDITFGARWDDDEDKIFFKLRQSSASSSAPDARVGIGYTPDAPLTVYHPTLTTVGSGLGGIRVHRPGSFGQFGYLEYGYGSGTTYLGSSYTGGAASNYGEIVLRQHSNGGTPVNALVISGSSNATFAGTISSGTITTSGNININTANDGLYFLGTNNRIYFNNHRAMEGDTAGGNLQIGEGYTTALVQANINVSPTHTIDMNGTTVIDASRVAQNLTGINLLADAANNANDAALYIRKTNNNDWAIKVDGTGSGTEYGIQVNLNGAHTYSYRGLNAGSQYFRVGTDMLLHTAEIRGNTFSVNGTTVIDSGRNISMGSSLTIAGDGGSNYTANHIRFMSHNTARGAGHFMMDDVGANTYYTGTAYADAFNNWGVHYKAANEDEETASTANRVLTVTKAGNLIAKGYIDTQNSGYNISGTQVISASRALQNITAVNANLRLSSNTALSSTTSGGTVRILFPGNGSHHQTGSTATGAIKLVLPVGMTNGMLTIKGIVYEYSTNQSFEFCVGGYNYPSGSTWQHNAFGYIKASPLNTRAIAIRFGFDGSKACIYLGETNSSWSYPQVSITECTVGYSSVSADTWDDGWDVTFATSFQNVTKTIAASDSRATVQRNANLDAASFSVGGTTVFSTGRALQNITGISMTGGSFTSYGSVTAGQGGIYTGSTERITNAGNLTNIGTINSGAITSTGDILLQGGNLTRNASNVGHFEGSYNNVGSNGLHSSPIYTLGANYNPALTTLGNMYGVGYTSIGASFISFNGGSNWGMYVAADGDARVWLDGSNGNVSAKGSVYAVSGYYVGNTNVIDSSRNFYASNYGRTSHHTGYLVGGYNNVGGSGGKSSPIYSIGSAYTTSDTSLGNIYGIGYTTYSTSLIGTIPGGNDWGMYVAAGGVGRVWLDGGNGNIGSVGGVYATNGYHVGTTQVIDSSRNITGAEVAASTRLYLNGGSYEGQIVFGTVDAWRTGIRQHDDGDAELRIWAKNANGRVHIATGYDGQPASIAKPTDGFVVDHNNVGIGNFSATDPSASLHVKGTVKIEGSHSSSISTPNINSFGALSSGTAYNYHMLFKQADGTVRGQITNNVYGTQYTGASDYRLKENIQPLSSATNLTLALSPCTFNWIQDADNTAVQGFVAHEVAAIVPEAVVGD